MDAAQFLDKLPPWFLTVLVIGLGMVSVTLISILAWILRGYWSDNKLVNKNQTTALIECTMAIQKLEIQIERLNEFLHVVPKLRTDIDIAHEKIRALENS